MAFATRERLTNFGRAPSTYMGTTIKIPFATTSILNTSLLLASVWAGLGSTYFAQESRDEYVDVDGSKIHLKILGEEFRSEDSVTIVLDSGGGADATQWATLQPRLANELETVGVSYDRFGFGESDLPKTTYNIRTEVSK